MILDPFYPFLWGFDGLLTTLILILLFGEDVVLFEHLEAPGFVLIFLLISEAKYILELVVLVK